MITRLEIYGIIVAVLGGLFWFVYHEIEVNAVSKQTVTDLQNANKALQDQVAAIDKKYQDDIAALQVTNTAHQTVLDQIDKQLKARTNIVVSLAQGATDDEKRVLATPLPRFSCVLTHSCGQAGPPAASVQH